METQLLVEFLRRLLIVLTVPMRNGNIFDFSTPFTNTNRSYRTYEEWKHGTLTSLSNSLNSSYRTYEEWKQILFRNYKQTNKVLTVPMRNGNDIEGFDSVIGSVGSYRTYEEWKQVSICFFNSEVWVLTVPMRNGNFLCSTLLVPVLVVLTVPMRNGNFVMVCVSSAPTRFLPYL